MFDTRNLTDPAAIKAWAEARGGRPAVNEGTSPHDDPSDLRLMFDLTGTQAATDGVGGGTGTGERLRPIGWDEWLRRFEAENLALWVQDRNADGQVSRYYQLTAREAYEDAHETGAPDLDTLRDAKA